MYFKSSINGTGIVLIESDWNLKKTKRRKYIHWSIVLIESDWNLKPEARSTVCIPERSINRIRLEFKVEVNISICRSAVCINRIRLEFKATQAYQRAFLFFVLIESDWNLKIDKTKMAFTTASVLIESDWNLKLQDKAEPCGQDGRINRIRLEFKGRFYSFLPECRYRY